MRYYVAGIQADFVELGDAFKLAAAEAIRTGEEQAVIVQTDTQHYCYAKVTKGDQA